MEMTMIMKHMQKHSILFLAGILLSAGTLLAQDPKGTVTYSLPQTTLTLKVEAVQEFFFAGPYAKFADKYLGISARHEDRTTCTLASVTLTPRIEADPSARYFANPEKTAFFALSSQGLISVADGDFGAEAQWRFPARRSADFSDKGVSENLTSESATLYRGVQRNTSFNRVAVQQSMVVEKSLEQRAKEAADMIFELRRKRVQIVTGDTDATYSGEAMGAALTEISALEKEYMSLFLGYSESQPQTITCDVVPVKDRKNQRYVAFRLSDADGLVSADDMSGKPYLLELVPQEILPATGKGGTAKGDVVFYRIPAICTVKLIDGVHPVLQSRVPVYQLGIESCFPLGK